MADHKTVYEDCDILIVGGGMAGTGATFESRYWGRDMNIVCVEKANIDRSGAVAQGLYAINCYMGTRWNENQPEDHERYARNDLTGMVREDLALEFPAMQNAITAEDKRWLQCDIKSIALLFNAYTKSIAYKKGAYEAILSRDNVVTEGCSSNVFIIKDKIIKTPPKSNLILPGITRDFIINDILQRKQYEILETKFSKKELLAADEVFITNSTQGVLSIVKIDNQIVNNEECGEITTQIYRNFIDYIR